MKKSQKKGEKKFLDGWEKGEDFWSIEAEGTHNNTPATQSKGRRPNDEQEGYLD